jgi:hypothetical protein
MDSVQNGYHRSAIVDGKGPGRHHTRGRERRVCDIAGNLVTVLLE